MYHKYLTPILMYSVVIIILGLVVHLNSIAYADLPARNYIINSTSIYGIPLSHSKLIGIQLSLSCIKMEEQKIKSHCLTYDKIKFLDNTNPLWSGTWINDTWYHRLIPRVSNSYIWNPNPFVVLVDPDGLFSIRAKMIIVQDNNFTWINPDEIANNTMYIVHIDRFVTAPCQSAIVAPIVSLVEDTVKYFESGCTKTSFNDKKIIYRTETPFDFLHCKQCIYDSWKAQAKLVRQNCITNVCNTLHDAHQNLEYYNIAMIHKKAR